MQAPRRWRAGFCRIASFISMSKCPSSERFRLMSIQSLKSHYLWISRRFLRLEIVGTIARQSNVNNYRDCSRRCSNAFSLVPLLRSSCPPPPRLRILAPASFMRTGVVYHALPLLESSQGGRLASGESSGQESVENRRTILLDGKDDRTTTDTRHKVRPTDIGERSKKGVNL